MKVIGENFVIIPEKHDDTLYHKLIFGDEENIKLLFRKIKINKSKNGFTEIKFKDIKEAELRVNKYVGNVIQQEYKNLIENETPEVIENSSSEYDDLLRYIAILRNRHQRPRFRLYNPEMYLGRHLSLKDRIIAYIKKYWLSILIGYFVGLIITVFIL